MQQCELWGVESKRHGAGVGSVDVGKVASDIIASDEGERFLIVTSRLDAMPFRDFWM